MKIYNKILLTHTYIGLRYTFTRCPHPKNFNAVNKCQSKSFFWKNCKWFLFRLLFWILCHIGCFQPLFLNWSENEMPPYVVITTVKYNFVLPLVSSPRHLSNLTVFFCLHVHAVCTHLFSMCVQHRVKERYKHLQFHSLGKFFFLLWNAFCFYFRSKRTNIFILWNAINNVFVFFLCCCCCAVAWN